LFVVIRSTVEVVVERSTKAKRERIPPKYNVENENCEENCMERKMKIFERIMRELRINNFRKC
jgi:hypothetical protein